MQRLVLRYSQPVLERSVNHWNCELQRLHALPRNRKFSCTWSGGLYESLSSRPGLAQRLFPTARAEGLRRFLIQIDERAVWEGNGCLPHFQFHFPAGHKRGWYPKSKKWEMHELSSTFITRLIGSPSLVLGERIPFSGPDATDLASSHGQGADWF